MGQCNFLHLWHQKLYRAFRFGTLWPISCSYPRHSQLTRHSLMLANGRIRQSLTALVVLCWATEGAVALWTSCQFGVSTLFTSPYRPEKKLRDLWIRHSARSTEAFISIHTSWCLPPADSRFAPSQWETALLCNEVSHWLGASLDSALVSWSAGHETTTIFHLNKTIICIILCCLFQVKGLYKRRPTANMLTDRMYQLDSYNMYFISCIYEN